MNGGKEAQGESHLSRSDFVVASRISDWSTRVVVVVKSTIVCVSVNTRECMNVGLERAATKTVLCNSI